VPYSRALENRTPRLGARGWPEPSDSWPTRSPLRFGFAGAPSFEPSTGANGNHARTNGFVSLGVVGSAAVVALVILTITGDS